MLRFSLSTVARRIREHGLVNLLPYSTISDEDLDGVVRDVQALFPNIYNIVPTLQRCGSAKNLRRESSRVTVASP